MKKLNSTILAVVFTTLAIFALPGCGSSGNDEPVDGTPVAPPVVEAGKPQVAAPYEITAHHDSTVAVHSHATPSIYAPEHKEEWTQVSGPTVALTTTTRPTTSFVMPADATQPVVLQHAVTNTQTGHETVTHHTVNPAPATTALSVIVSKPVEVVSGNKASLHVSASGGDGTYTYAWTQTSGSAVIHFDAVSHNSAPTFITPAVSVEETLEFIVEVSDGKSTVSATEIITVTSAPSVNTVPVAVASVSTIHPKTNTEVTLNGTKSHDGDGDRLSYTWHINVFPVGSTASLSDANSVVPTFTPDVDGVYIFHLLVYDGKVDSDPTTVALTATPAHTNAKPVAVAYVSPTDPKTNTKVTLYGERSHDAETDNLALSYTWSINSAPGGSTASLSDASFHKTAFTPDVGGKYTFQLIVNDGTVASAPAHVTFTATEPAVNSAPIVNAGPDQTVKVGVQVTLDASGSKDDGLNQALTYLWATHDSPGAYSGHGLSDYHSKTPTFTPRNPGFYNYALLVYDGEFYRLDYVGVTVE